MAEARMVALVGNPNCGKSSLFNALTGLRAKVGNFPGVTVDRKSGPVSLPDGRTLQLVDLPGLYNLYPTAEDEGVSAEVLRNPTHPDHPAEVVVVADATNLRRALVLLGQVADLGLPCLLALNMADLLAAEGIEIDENKLSNLLGIPVVKTSALNHEGLDRLKKVLSEGLHPRTSPFFRIPEGFAEGLAAAKRAGVADRDYLAFQALCRPADFPWVEGLALEQAAKAAGITAPQDLLANELTVRLDLADAWVEAATKASPPPRARLTERLDRIFLHPILGYVLFLGILLLIFQAIFAWAQYPMEAIDGAFGAAGEWMESVLPASFFSDLLIKGIWAGLSGIVIFIPQIAFLFLFITILEDTGYMSRVVFLMDRLVRPFGFSGKSVIPLIGGMACAVPSIMLTRSIPNRKERLITLMVVPLMSCSARIPVYILLISLFVPDTSLWGVLNLQGLVMTGMYFLSIFMALVVAFVLKKIVKSSGESPFTTELPVFRSPRWGNALLLIVQKCKTFVLEAGKVILLISVVLWLLSSYGPGGKMKEIRDAYATQISAAPTDSVKAELSHSRDAALLQESYAGHFGRAIEPGIRPLGFDWKIGISLVTSFAAREVFVGTMATLYSAGEEAAEDQGGRFAGLRAKMLAERDPETGEPVYGLATSLALLVFYAFAMQCMSTLAVVKKETRSWVTTLGMLAYMTGLAYLSALVVYQVLA